jgi:hypothetical protein
MDPSAAAYLALPDVLQYNMDGSVPRSDSLFQLVANFLHDSQTNLRAWTTAALAEPPVPVPSSGVQLSVVLWRLSSVWESPWYPNRFLRAVVNCPVYVNPALPYECFTTLADRLAPLRVDQMEWIDMGAFARVRPPLATASGAAAADTKVIGWFASVGLFDRTAVPFFITLGIFGLLRWSTFFIRFIPALIFLFFESRRRRHHRSLLYTAERDATIIVPTIDSGPELKAAITSWLRNRPKRIIFATIHRETHSIIRLLKETCEEFEAQQQKEAEAKAARGNVTNEFLGAEWVHRDVDIEDGLQAKPNPASAPIGELVHEVSPTPASTPLLNAELAWRTQVDVISVSRPNKRQQMVAALAHVDTDIFVLADDDAIWPG